MLAFYEAYTAPPAGAASEQGVHPARALRAAQRRVRGEWDHPFFWGGFSVFGE